MVGAETGIKANYWWATVAAFSASLVGIGFARFAYTPLVPAIIEAGWFSAGAVAYLGAANLVGYLLGAVAARPLAARLSPTVILKAMMALTAVGILACAWPLSFAWFFFWRFASGFSGAVLMVLAAPIVLAHVPANRRGLASGVIFTGVGFGIAGSGTLVPLLLRGGVAEAWIGLGALSIFLAVVSWGGWPSVAPLKSVEPALRVRPGRRLLALYAEYTLQALGMVPFVIFLSDYVARGLGWGLDSGGYHWGLVGAGGLVGSVIAGYLADRIGFGPALKVAYFIQIPALAVPTFLPLPGLMAGAMLVVGICAPGTIALVLGRIRELLPGDPVGQQASWGMATLCFSVGQAACAYFYSFIYAQTGNYPLIFGIGLGALVLCTLVHILANRGGHAPGQ